jgi:hypothetical protein
MFVFELIIAEVNSYQKKHRLIFYAFSFMVSPGFGGRFARGGQESYFSILHQSDQYYSNQVFHSYLIE